MKSFKKFAALGLVGAMTVTSLFACAKSPEEKVEDAFKTIGKSASSAALAEELGITAVMDKVQGEALEAGIKLSLDDTDISDLAMLVSGSIDASIAADEKALISLGVGYAASELLSAELYVDDKQIALALPELLDKVPYFEYSGNLEKKIKDSVLYKQAGFSEEDIAMFTDMLKGKMVASEDDELTKFILDFADETKAFDDFNDAIEIEEIEAKELEINGKDKKCEGFEIVIPEEAIVKLVKEFMDYYLSDDAKDVFEEYFEQYAEENAYDVDSMMDELDTLFAEITDNTDEILSTVEGYISDIEAEMYIYEGEIASLEVMMEISDPSGSLGGESFEVGFELECTGGDYGMYDNYELDIKMLSMTMLTISKETSNDGDKYETEWSLGGMAMQGIKASAGYAIDKKDGDFEFEAVFDDSYNSMSCVAEGAVEVEKKSSVTIDVDSMKLVVDDELIFEVSGECYIKSGAKVDMPKGEKFDILTDKQSEWDEFAEDVNNLQYSLYDIMEKLN